VGTVPLLIFTTLVVVWVPVTSPAKEPEKFVAVAAEVAVIVPVPLVPRLEPVPTTIAAVVLVEPVTAENAKLVGIAEVASINCPAELVPTTVLEAGTASPLTLTTLVALCVPVTSPASEPEKLVAVVAEVAAIVPVPEAASEAPEPTTIAAEVLVAPVRAEKAVAAVDEAARVKVFPEVVIVIFAPGAKLIAPAVGTTATVALSISVMVGAAAKAPVPNDTPPLELTVKAPVEAKVASPLTVCGA